MAQGSKLLTNDKMAEFMVASGGCAEPSMWKLLSVQVSKGGVGLLTRRDWEIAEQSLPKEYVTRAKAYGCACTAPPNTLFRMQDCEVAELGRPHAATLAVPAAAAGEVVVESRSQSGTRGPVVVGRFASTRPSAGGSATGGADSRWTSRARLAPERMWRPNGS